VKTNWDEVLESAHFQSCLKEADYNNAGRYTPVAFTDSRKPGIIYIGDSRHYAGCILLGGNPTLTYKPITNHHIMFAPAIWAEEAGPGLINAMISNGDIPRALWVGPEE
jgi:hypothetical protein